MKRKESSSWQLIRNYWTHFFLVVIQRRFFPKGGLVHDLKKAFSERLFNTELDAHLDSVEERESGNIRNGSSKKTMLTGPSKITLDIPRDRPGTFDPQSIAKYQRRFPESEDKIISMYARGMTMREIRGHLEELYDIDVWDLSRFCAAPTIHYFGTKETFE